MTVAAVEVAALLLPLLVAAGARALQPIARRPAVVRATAPGSGRRQGGR